MIHAGTVQIAPAGIVAAIAILLSLFFTLWWMLHPPKTKADLAAKQAERQLKEQLGTSIVVFSSDIRSEHMMVLASRLARGQRGRLLAAYIIEVPFTLPTLAEMPEEDRAALDILAAAEAIAKNHNCEVQTEIIHHRQTSQAVLELAKREKAQLIIMGSYREGKYSGAPLSRTIESIAANAKCDVLIGVEGKHGTLLMDEPALPMGGTPGT
ncbi:MAG: universal stress protein [Candidatus Eremiobacteraeota bacterium]|nr:universal stress protein [Candidatus Eremiobacteraeota bacterium]